MNHGQVLANIILFIFMILILSYVVSHNKKQQAAARSHKVILYIGVFISFFGIVIANTFSLEHIWMLGPIWIAALCHPYLGIWFHFIFTYLFCILSSSSLKQFGLLFILGMVICLSLELISKEQWMGKQKLLTYLYCILIAMSCHFTLILIMDQFMLTLIWSKDTLYSMIYTMLIVIIGVTLYGFSLKDTSNPPVAVDLEGETVVKYKSCDEILNPNFELLRRLQSFSESLYQHSLRVSELSYAASELLGSDSKVVMAGSLYHEIGCIEGTHYIENGQSLARQYQFPEQVVTIIGEHNVKNKLPTSLESAIVMLSDSILSTLEYIDNNKKSIHCSRKDVISSLIENRLQKGYLDESGITIKDYQMLKEYFCNHIP